MTTQHPVTPFGPPAHFYEDPRWHDGRWWAVDMRGQTVFSFAADGEARIELQLDDDRPSGLGWLPDGTFLVVSMHKRWLLARAPGARSFEIYADVGPLLGETLGFLNDMTVTPEGHAYVAFDADYQKYPADAGLGMIVRVAPGGRAEIAASGLEMPNGIVFTPDRSTLVVAETLKPQFSAFPVLAGGSLGARTIWADMHPKRDKRPAGGPPLGDEIPALDGCWMDSEGCIWVADSRSACLRVAPGGDVVDAIFLPGDMRSWACCLSGEDGKSLLICGADFNFQDRMSRKGSQLYIARV